MSNEQNLVNDLVSTNSKINPNPLTIISSSVSTKTYCDLEFNGTIPSTTNKIDFCLEVKSDKSSSKFNNFLLTFGDVLKNRKIVASKNSSYGFLLEYHVNDGMDSFFIKQIQNYIDSKDWDAFGTMYGCDYIFFYDDAVHELYYAKWAGFVNASTIHKWF